MAPVGAAAAADEGNIAPVLPNMREAITAQLLHLSKLGILILEGKLSLQQLTRMGRYIAFGT